MNGTKKYVEDPWDLFYNVDPVEAINYPKMVFVSSFSYAFIVTVSYLVFVLFMGPRIMKNVQPLNITPLILLYNFVQVLFNIYLFVEATRYLVIQMKRGNLQCISKEPFDSEYYEEVRFNMWMLAINKSLDLLDTVFFVFRKKWSHLTFLHVYHHTLTFCGGWFIAKYAPGGMIVIFGFMNTFVHTIMYSYYFMSACPYFGLRNYAKYLRKTTTRLQITQFTIAGIHGLWSLQGERCNYPRELIYFGLSQDAIMLFLFTNFYVKAYIKPKKQVDNEII